MRHYAGFTEHQRRASEHGVELYLLDHPAACTRGRCTEQAIVNGAWCYVVGTGRLSFDVIPFAF